jgi:hypothetical protein
MKLVLIQAIDSLFQANFKLKFEVIGSNICPYYSYIYINFY